MFSDIDFQLDQAEQYATDLAGSEVVLFSNEELVRNLSSSGVPGIYVESCVLGHGHYRYSNKYELNQNLVYDPEEPGKCVTKSYLIQAKCSIL